ncbi:MAG: hypothetical protein HOA22_14350, partial [Gammaproteobacteria bacterium]|nr:hypothetical protein [Gammaproteobacteria bacterium]
CLPQAIPLGRQSGKPPTSNISVDIVAPFSRLPSTVLVEGGGGTRHLCTAAHSALLCDFFGLGMATPLPRLRTAECGTLEGGEGSTDRWG